MSKVDHDVLEAIAKLRSGKDISQVIAEGVKPEEASDDVRGLAISLSKDTDVRKAAQDNLLVFAEYLRANAGVNLTSKHFNRLALEIINIISNE